MLMGWGPYRFEVPSYSFETKTQQSTGRIDNAAVIGRTPITHILGEDVQEISLKSVFHPRFLNGGGLRQLRSIREAVLKQESHILMHVSGRNFGRWIAKDVDGDETLFDPGGIPNQVETTLSLQRYTSLQIGTQSFGLL